MSVAIKIDCEIENPALAGVDTFIICWGGEIVPRSHQFMSVAIKIDCEIVNPALAGVDTHYFAEVVKLVDTYVSGAYVERHEGSSPFLSIFWKRNNNIVLIFINICLRRATFVVFGVFLPQTPDPLLSASNKSGQKCLSAHFAISNNTSLRSVLAKFEAEPNYYCGN